MSKTQKMEVLERHEELIESKPEDISIIWKILQIFLYFLSAIGGYGSSILFHILWHDIFAEKCPLWADMYPHIQTHDMPEEVPIEDFTETVLPDWRQSVSVSFRYSRPCRFYHLITLCSCTFGIVWMTLFTMCGKGGYDTRIFTAPWTVVPPAIIFQVIFTILVLIAVHNLEDGYSSFLGSLQVVTSLFNDTRLNTLDRPCEFLQHYLEAFDPPNYDVCRTYSALQILSWIMAWSWILGLAALVIRVISVRDFTLLTVTLYEVQEVDSEKSSTDQTSATNIEIVSETGNNDNST